MHTCARTDACARAYMCIFVSRFEISMKLPFKRYKVCPNRTIINEVMGSSILKVDLGLWHRCGHVAGVGTCGRVWQAVGTCDRGGGRVSGHVAGVRVCGRGSALAHRWRHAAEVGTCGEVWKHVAGCGDRWQGWWQGVGACGRGGGMSYGVSSSA